MITEAEADEKKETKGGKHAVNEATEGAVGQPVDADLIEVDNESEDAKRRLRARNYSFADKLADPQKSAKFETVDVKGLGEVSIPATIGSTYWAILRVMYERPNQPVYPDQLVKLVAELMEEAFPDRWDNYTGKAETTVFRRVDQKRDRQKIKTWQDRIIGNAKTLTRIGGTAQYGMRLKERGHLLRFEYDGKKKPCFVLHTTIPKKPAKVEEAEKPAEAAE
jgi:hypothetical protein